MSRFNQNNGGFLDKKVSFRLDEGRYSSLEEIARKEGFPVSQIVRHLVIRYIEEHKRFSVNPGSGFIR